MTENEISNIIIGCAIDVHKEFGPRLLESAYLKLGNYRLGLIINFQNRLLKDGIKRFIN